MYDNIHTASSKLTMVEEGIREQLPSSHEIHFPADLGNILNVTHANMKRHANQHSRARKTRGNRPQNSYRNSDSAKTQTEKQNFDHKRFFLHSY